MTKQFQKDIAAIGDIAAVPTILDVVCRTTGMGFAAVARVTRDRWIACAVRDQIHFGMKPGDELQIDTTICHEIFDSGKSVLIDHVAEDETYSQHHTPKMYGFQSYVSVPIRLPSGEFFGTLCAIDPEPARVNRPEIVGMFELFADLIAFHLDTREKMAQSEQRLAQSETRLSDERSTAELREQFIAVLGHDLRNPLGAIDTGAQLLKHMKVSPRITEIATLMLQSTSRMSALIDDVLDFARGRLGTGLNIAYDADEPLQPVLQHVVAELGASWPGRVIEEQYNINRPIPCDRRRIAQLFSNILGNALTYGDHEAPVHIAAETTAENFTLTVRNAGNPIPPATLEKLFQPFSRGAVRASQQGLGLGLYIAAEVARAHDGTLEATSTSDETCFTFRMPLDEVASLPHSDASAA